MRCYKCGIKLEAYIKDFQSGRYTFKDLLRVRMVETPLIFSRGMRPTNNNPRHRPKQEMSPEIMWHVKTNIKVTPKVIYCCEKFGCGVYYTCHTTRWKKPFSHRIKWQH